MEGRVQGRGREREERDVDVGIKHRSHSERFGGRATGGKEESPNALFSENSNAKLFRNCDARRIRSTAMRAMAVLRFPPRIKKAGEEERKEGQIDVRESLELEPAMC